MVRILRSKPKDGARAPPREVEEQRHPLSVAMEPEDNGKGRRQTLAPSAGGCPLRRAKIPAMALGFTALLFDGELWDARVVGVVGGWHLDGIIRGGDVRG
jgi:hypothetical protein